LIPQWSMILIPHQTRLFQRSLLVLSPCVPLALPIGIYTSLPALGWLARWMENEGSDVTEFVKRVRFQHMEHGEQNP
jgi:hypothetical protein